MNFLEERILRDGIVKGFQEGGAFIRSQGYRLESLAIVEQMDAAQGTVSFREQ